MNNVSASTVWTPAERAFLTFTQPFIEQCILSRMNIVCIATSTKIQNDFSDWVKKNFKANAFTDQDLNLVVLVASIWNKSLNQTNRHIVDNSKDFEAVTKEVENRKEANRLGEKLSEESQTSKVFTLMQATFLRI